MSDIGEMTFRPEAEAALREGRKIATTRRNPHGRKGDIFHAFGMTFRLDRVDPGSLAEAAGQYHHAEGHATVSDYLRWLAECYPEEIWTENRIVWVHLFHRVPDAPGAVATPPVVSAVQETPPG
jgi:hypothetical protein